MMDQLTQELLSLLAIDSLTGQEETLSRHLAQRLESMQAFTLMRTGLSLIALGPQVPGRPTLALYGHLDTVANQQDQAPHVQEGKIYGCGASDMKGGLAIMLALMQEVEQGRQPLCNLQLVFYDKEEGPYDQNGLGPVLEEHACLRQADLAFALEPTDNQIHLGCLGGLHGLVTFQGKSAHSARPWQGDNALHKAAGLLHRLAALERRKVSFAGLDFYEVIHATQAWTKGSRNSIPGEFTLNINYRFAPGKAVAQAQQEFLDLVAGEAQVEFVDVCPSAPVVENNPILDGLLARHALKCEPKQAWTDIARLALYGIPAVNLGPGQTAQAHQKNEWIDQAQLLKGYSLFEDLILAKA